MTPSGPTVWIIGSGRLYLRIPLMRRLRDRGFQMGAVGQDCHPEFDSTEFTYFQYPLRRSLNPLADRHALNRLIELFQRHRPDVVHAVNTKPSILVPKAAEMAGVPATVATITGMGAAFSSSSPLAHALRVVYRHALRRASRTTAITAFQNPDDRDYFLTHGMVKPSRAALVLSSGLDVEEYRKRCGDSETLAALRRELRLDGCQVVLMIARLIRPKGVIEYLKAAAAVRSRHPNTVFLLVGTPVTEGPLALPLEVIHQSAANVRFLGNRSDVPSLLALSDVCVLPSYFREGIPRVLLEAGAVGLPLVTTDSPGCRETVRHGWNGLIVPPRNWRAVADAIERLLASPSLRWQFGDRSVQFVQDRFDLDKVAASYAEIYRTALTAVQHDSIATRRAA